MRLEAQSWEEGNCFHCDCSDITMKSGNMIRDVRSFSLYWTQLEWVYLVSDVINPSRCSLKKHQHCMS